MDKYCFPNLSITDRPDCVKNGLAEEIKVIVHIPTSIAETTKQQKINRIYDILNPEKSR